MIKDLIMPFFAQGQSEIRQQSTTTWSHIRLAKNGVDVFLTIELQFFLAEEWKNILRHRT
jgi:hypothetical protein